MPRPALEVADIFRDHGPAWRAQQAGHLSLDRSSAGNLTKFGPQPASLLTSWYLPFFIL